MSHVKGLLTSLLVLLVISAMIVAIGYHVGITNKKASEEFRRKQTSGEYVTEWWGLRPLTAKEKLENEQLQLEVERQRLQNEIMAKQLE